MLWLFVFKHLWVPETRYMVGASHMFGEWTGQRGGQDDPPRTAGPESTERNEDKWWQVGNFKVWGSGFLAWATNQQPSQFMDEEQVRGGYTH